MISWITHGMSEGMDREYSCTLATQKHAWGSAQQATQLRKGHHRPTPHALFHNSPCSTPPLPRPYLRPPVSLKYIIHGCLLLEV